MKRKFIRVLCILFVFLSMFAPVTSADLFGSDDKKMEMILREIKKVNTRIMDHLLPKIKQTHQEIKNLKAEISQVKSEMNKLKSGNNSLVQQMDTMTSVIPGIQASMEQAQAQASQETQALGKRLAQLETKIMEGKKAELDAIKQEISANLQGLKGGMAKDMEQIAKINQGSFQELIKSNEKHLNNQNIRVDKSIAVMTEIAKGGSKNSEVLASLQAGLVANSKALSDQNKKIIEILAKSLMEQQGASTKMDTLGGNQAKSDENVKFARETMVALKGILDKRLAEIDKTQQALQLQNDQAMQNTDLIKQNLLVADQKINKLAEGLQAIQSQQIDAKFTTLIDTTKSLAANASAVNAKVDASLLKLDEGKSEANLTSVKISKLIGILKAIAEEQGKLELIIESQKGKRGSNKQILDALEDLRRKANVAISRNDSILKKLGGSKK